MHLCICIDSLSQMRCLAVSGKFFWGLGIGWAEFARVEQRPAEKTKVEEAEHEREEQSLLLESLEDAVLML